MAIPESNDRQRLEARILASAFKQSFDRNDTEGARLAHKELARLLRLASDLEDRGDSKDRGKELSARSDERGSGDLPGGELPLRKPVSRLPQEAACPAAGARARLDPYELLDVDRFCQTDAVRAAFLRKARALVRQLAGETEALPDSPGSQLQELWLAYDILRSATARADHDLRRLGLRDNEARAFDLAAGSEPGPADLPGALSIPELLLAAEIIDAGELALAVGMASAMPEMPLGEFLVKQELISRDLLEAALIGQQLIRQGMISTGHYQIAMRRKLEANVCITKTLITCGWLTQGQLDEIQRTGETSSANPTRQAESTIREIVVADKTEAASQIEQIKASSFVPTWANELDWSEPDEGSASGDAESEADDTLQV